MFCCNLSSQRWSSLSSIQHRSGIAAQEMSCAISSVTTLQFLHACIQHQLKNNKEKKLTSIDEKQKYKCLVLEQQIDLLDTGKNLQFVLEKINNSHLSLTLL